MKFKWVIFYVSDVEKTLLFYEQAFGVERRFVSDGGEYGELESGETRIGFAAHWMSEGAIDGGVVALDPTAQPQAAELGFATDDVEAALGRALGAGATPVSEPEEKPWGQTVAYVRDLNGVLVEIATDLP